MKKSFDAKTILMETAIRLIRNSHYHHVGVAEICKQSGVTKGCFYHHFESKGDLFYQSAAYYREGMREALDEVFQPEAPPLERVKRLIDFIIAKQEDNRDEHDRPIAGCPFFASAGSAGPDGEKIRLAGQEMAEGAIRYNIRLAQDLQRDFPAPHPLDPEQSGRMLYQYIMGLMMYGNTIGDLEIVKQDIHAGVCRILGLSPAGLSV